MMTKILAGFLIVLIMSSGHPAKRITPPFVEKRDLDFGMIRGHAVLSVEKEEFAVGEQFSVDIRFVNQNANNFFYNPFFCRLLPMPGELVLYDGDQKYLRGFLDFRGGSMRGVSRSDWILV